MVFLGVNRSGLGTSSTTNYKFYRAVGQCHGPWCKQSLGRVGSHGVPTLNHVSKSQHGGEVPTFEPPKTINVWLIIIKSRILIVSFKNVRGGRVESWV